MIYEVRRVLQYRFAAAIEADCDRKSDDRGKAGKSGDRLRNPQKRSVHIGDCVACPAFPAFPPTPAPATGTRNDIAALTVLVADLRVRVAALEAK